MYCKDDLLAYRMAPSKGRASPRLRAACDRCYQAKVKCSYNEGSVSCIRCQKRDVPCIRSPSLSQGRAKGRTPTVFKAQHSSSPGSSSTSSHGAPSSRPPTGREDQAGQSLSCMDSSTPPLEDVQVPMDLALAEPTDFSGLALDWPGIGTLPAPWQGAVCRSRIMVTRARHCHRRAAALPPSQRLREICSAAPWGAAF